MIRRLLLSNGWKDKTICNCFASLLSLELPVPKSREKGGAREAFFYLSTFACLYVSAVAFVILLFNLIEISIPDALQPAWDNDWIYSSIRSSLSTVVVFFPLYLLFSWLIHRDTQCGRMTSGGGVQRWLTYLTLFVIVMTILIDAASLLFWLLEGEMTIRLLLKATVLFAVMLGVFVYIWRGSLEWSMKSKIDTGSGQI